MWIRNIFYQILVLFFVCLACENKIKTREPNKKVVADSTIAPATAFNNLFLDSAKIQKFLDKDSEYIIYQQQYFDFYKQRNYEYAWFDKTRISEQASNFMNLLNTTIIETNDSSLYNRKLVTLYNSFVTDSSKHLESSPLQTELYLTGQFFAYASKVYNNNNIDATELGWFIPKKKFDFTALVDSVIISKGKRDKKKI